jgi:glycosyltransferase involved in cell wall biosynthesis
MRVCHIWDNFFPIESGGVERYILNLSDHLSHCERDISFKIITDKSFIPFFRTPQISSYQKINTLEVHRLGPNLSSILRNTHCKLLKRKSKALEYLTAVNLFKQALKIPSIEKVDIFHLHGLWLPLFPTIGLRLSQHLKKPLVITLHGESIDYRNVNRMNFESPIMQDVLEHANIITTYSQEILKALSARGFGKKAQLVPNFIDTEKFTRPVIGRKKADGVVMVSRLDATKDPITAIRAFSGVVKEIPTATLQIIGYGPLYQDAHDLVHDLNLEKSVFLLGKKNNVNDFLSGNNIFLATRAAYIATLEASAAGLAVIAPASGILKEIILDGENGLLVQPKNDKELTLAIIRLLKNEELKQKLIANGIRTAKKYDIRSIAPQMTSVYSALS